MRQGATPGLQGGNAVLLIAACLSFSFLAYEYSNVRNSGVVISITRDNVEPVRWIFLQGNRARWIRPLLIPFARVDGYFRKEKIRFI